MAVIRSKFGGDGMLKTSGLGAVGALSIDLDGAWKSRNLAQLPETFPTGAWVIELNIVAWVGVTHVVDGVPSLHS